MTINRSTNRKIIRIAVPMMIQNGISNFVSLLDNLMLGQVDTNAFSGAAIANQMVFIFFLVIFGATAGAGIFTAQYHGKGDTEGVRTTFRFKIVLNSILSIACITVFLLFSRPLITLFLQGEGTVEDAAATLRYGMSYMRITTIGLFPVGIMMAYSGTLRDIGKPTVPMAASMAAIFVNLTGNALLIYGLFGLPALGSDGAAIATVIARFVELSILLIYTGTHSSKFPFIKGAFRSLRVPLKSAWMFFIRSLPLIANETLWATGMAVLNQRYSTRSLDVVTAISIEITLWNLVCVVFLSMGEAVGIVAGHMLGNGEAERARKESSGMILLTTSCGVFCALLLLAVSPFFPRMYDVSPEIMKLATTLIIVYAFFTPVHAFIHVSYFIIRAGGNTFITFLFDSFFVWAVSVPAAFLLSIYTSMTVVQMVITVMSLEMIKCIIGGIMVRSGVWAKNIVRD